jgi:hypothetical protein
VTGQDIVHGVRAQISGDIVWVLTHIFMTEHATLAVVVLQAAARMATALLAATTSVSARFIIIANSVSAAVARFIIDSYFGRGKQAITCCWNICHYLNVTLNI